MECMGGVRRGGGESGVMECSGAKWGGAGLGGAVLEGGRDAPPPPPRTLFGVTVSPASRFCQPSMALPPLCARQTSPPNRCSNRR